MEQRTKRSLDTDIANYFIRGKKGIACLLGLILIGALQTLSAQNVRKYSNDFLTIGVGAKAFAMSGAVVSLSDDVTAGYWNPAKLVNVKDNLQATFMHAAYLGGVANYDFWHHYRCIRSYLVRTNSGSILELCAPC